MKTVSQNVGAFKRRKPRGSIAYSNFKVGDDVVTPPKAVDTFYSRRLAGIRYQNHYGGVQIKILQTLFCVFDHHC
jgi:hypothetical protein